MEGVVKMRNTWKNKVIFISGANGFLGAHLSLRFAKEGARVIGLIKDNFPVTYLRIELERKKTKKIKIIKSDIVNFDAMLKIFKKYDPDACIHVAAQPIVGVANKSPLPTFEANIKGTWNILEIARACGTKAVVVASSDKAYGEHKKLPYTEDAPLLALHPYDASKTCTDILARVYAHTYGLNTAVTRCANIYGGGDFNFSRIIPDTMRSIIENKNPVIRSSGTPLRDYIYIDDIVEAYLLLAEKLYVKKIRPGEAFNFGTGKPISVLALVKKILNIAGKTNLRPEIMSKGKIKGEIDRQYLSSAKAKNVLGWKARYPLDKGLRKTYEWYLKFFKCQSC